MNVNATESHKCEVNIGSGNDLVPSGNKPLPEPMLTQIIDTFTSLGPNVLGLKVYDILQSIDHLNGFT